MLWFMDLLLLLPPLISILLSLFVFVLVSLVLSCFIYYMLCKLWFFYFIFCVFMLFLVIFGLNWMRWSFILRWFVFRLCKMLIGRYPFEIMWSFSIVLQGFAFFMNLFLIITCFWWFIGWIWCYFELGLFFNCVKCWLEDSPLRLCEALLCFCKFWCSLLFAFGEICFSHVVFGIVWDSDWETTFWDYVKICFIALDVFVGYCYLFCKLNMWTKFLQFSW